MVSRFPVPEWIVDANIYEVNLRQYTYEGSFRAFEKELPRLRDMGVDILWFMPITPISREKMLGSLGSYYACCDYKATNPEFGSLEDFRSLVRYAHELGMRVIIDWVANHTGWGHRWTREHPDYYRLNAAGSFYDANGWEDVIDLNYENPELRQAMVEAMRFWVEEADVDGFRCDMAMLVPLSFWEEARLALDRIKKLFWLAECEQADYFQVFDAGYAWRFLHAMEAYWRKETDIPGLIRELDYYRREFPPQSIHCFFTSNHDENSHQGTEYERMGGAALPFAVLCCTWNAMPLVYSGQEIPNHRRIKFFDKDEFPWTGNNALHGFYKTLLELRKRNKALRTGDPGTAINQLRSTADNSIFAFIREGYGDQVMVVLNLSAENQFFSFAEPLPEADFENAFTGETRTGTGLQDMELGPWGYAVYYKVGG